jgi:nitroreductase
METKKVINERRSVNFFDKNKPLDNETLQNIVNLAVMAPSGFNLQPWRLIAVQSNDAKQRLFELAFKQEKVIEAPVTFILVADKEGYAATNPVWEEMVQSMGGNREMVAGYQQMAVGLYGSSEERKLKFAESNAGLLAMSLMYAAKEYGVDSHPMSGMDYEGIHKEFKLKESETVVMLICMGSFDESKTLYPRRPRRLFNEIATIV